MRVGAMPCLPEPPFSVCVLLCQVEQCTQLLAIRGGRNVFFFFSFPGERCHGTHTAPRSSGAVWSYFGSFFHRGVQNLGENRWFLFDGLKKRPTERAYQDGGAPDLAKHHGARPTRCCRSSELRRARAEPRPGRLCRLSSPVPATAASARTHTRAGAHCGQASACPAS